MRKKIISIIVALMIALTIPVVTPPSYVTTQASAQTNDRLNAIEDDLNK